MSMTLIQDMGEENVGLLRGYYGPDRSFCLCSYKVSGNKVSAQEIFLSKTDAKKVAFKILEDLLKGGKNGYRY